MNKEQLIKELNTHYIQIRDDLALTSYEDSDESPEALQAFDDGWNAGFREALKLINELM